MIQVQQNGLLSQSTQGYPKPRATLILETISDSLLLSNQTPWYNNQQTASNSNTLN